MMREGAGRDPIGIVAYIWSTNVKAVSFATACAVLLAAAPPLTITRAAASELHTQGNVNLCVDLNQSNGTINLWTCNAGANQNFFGGYGPQRFNGQCLDQASTSGSNMWLVFKACANVPTQRWGVSPAGELKNEAGYCLDVPYGNAAQNQRLQMFSCNGGRNQKWILAPAHVAAAPPAPPRVVPTTPTPSNPSGLVSTNGGNVIITDGGALPQRR